MRDHAYSAHELLVAPARRYPELWRLVLGLLIAAAVAFALSSLISGVLSVLAPGFASATLSPEAAQGNTPATLLILLFSFGLVIVGIFVAARLLQDRRPLDLIGPMPLALVQFGKVILALAALGAVLMILPPYDMGMALVPNLDTGTWLALLPVSLAAILVQTASEELLFRGYIQQSLAARFKSPLVWMVVPSLLFGLGHFTPLEAGENAWLVAIWAVAFGILMSDLTARAGTLGPAIALHMVNNVTALLIVATPDMLNGLALSTTPYSMSDTGQMRSWLLIDFGFMTVSWLAARLAIRR